MTLHKTQKPDQRSDCWSLFCLLRDLAKVLQAPRLHQGWVPVAQASPSPLPGAGTWEQNTTLGDSTPKEQGDKSPPSLEMEKEEKQTAELPLRTWGDPTIPLWVLLAPRSSSAETRAGHSLHQPQYFHCKLFVHYFKKSAVKIPSRLDVGNQRLCLGETYFTCTIPLSY